MQAIPLQAKYNIQLYESTFSHRIHGINKSNIPPHVFPQKTCKWQNIMILKTRLFINANYAQQMVQTKSTTRGQLQDLG